MRANRVRRFGFLLALVFAAVVVSGDRGSTTPRFQGFAKLWPMESEGSVYYVATGGMTLALMGLHPNPRQLYPRHSFDEIGDAHVDCFQTFDNNGEFGHNVTIDGNLCTDFHQGFMGEAHYYHDISHITF